METIDEIRRSFGVRSYRTIEEVYHANRPKLRVRASWASAFADRDWEEVKQRAKRWNDVKIEMRAKGSPLEDTYQELYRYGSSLDHSDSWSANQYVGRRDGDSFLINNAPSDELVGIALGYSLQTMIILFEVLCRAFGITERERLATLLAEFKRLNNFPGANQGMQVVGRHRRRCLGSSPGSRS